MRLTQHFVAVLMVLFGFAGAIQAELISEIRPTMVTADFLGSHEATAGTSSFGLNHDGVARLLRQGGGCSGSLLASGRHVITAAHCLAPAYIPGWTIIWNLPSGQVSVTVDRDQFIVHPSYDGNVHHGFDVGIIELPTVVDPNVPRYEIFRGQDQGELDVETTIKVGYGRSGHGDSGFGCCVITKRAGLNEWDSLGIGVGGITNLSTQLTYDFDNGLAAQDAFNFFFSFTPDLGRGVHEVMAAPGDSGGPSFIDVGGTLKIAGTASYIFRLVNSGGLSSDINGGLNSSFGELGVDVRLADPEILSFIDATVPEPTGFVLAAIVLASVTLWRWPLWQLHS